METYKKSCGIRIEFLRNRKIHLVAFLMVCLVGLVVWSHLKAELVWDRHEQLFEAYRKGGMFSGTDFEEAYSFFVRVTEVPIRAGYVGGGGGLYLEDNSATVLASLREWHAHNHGRLYWSFVDREVKVLPRDPWKQLWHRLFTSPQPASRRNPEVYRSPAT